MDILIIDDDAVDRMSTVRTLNRSELDIGTIDQAETASGGINQASTHRYDVILLDYKIPPSNGIEILREIRGIRDYTTAVIMLSHSDDEELALSCIEAGAQDYIMKSEVSAPRLKRAILIASERHELEQQVKESHEKMRFIAERDSLTGLKNRYFFDEALKDAVQRAYRGNHQIALLLLDIDYFKKINDVMGHPAGDSVLKEFALRLESTIRQNDKLCRLGGDEFALLIEDLVTLEQVRLVTSRIFQCLKKPIRLNNEEIQVTVSIGIATYPTCMEDATGLMKCADVAMYRSKVLGRNQAQYYSKDFHEKIEYRVQLENALKIAISEKQFTLFYQPQIDGKTGRLTGFEALIRWKHKELGLLAPDQFIPIAEESQLIIDIGRWVINEACQQFSEWVSITNTEGLTFTIAVNLSARQLKDNNLSQFLLNCLEHYNIPPQLVELELTESSLENSICALDMLNQLAEIGVKLSLDDFGTGYSSLSHLSQFPFSIIKIDKSFVQTIHEEKQESLLRAICAFAHSLGYETVAEGVETEEQKDLCVSLGVTKLQGYLFSKPMPACDIVKTWLKHRINQELS